MHQQNSKVINVENELKGRPMITSETGQKLGEVVDAIVQPTSGAFLGLAIRTPKGEERGVPGSFLTIGPDAVMVRGVISEDRDDVAREIQSGELALHDLVNTSVVTDDGVHLGRISEVWLDVDNGRVAYRIIESSLQRLFNGGFFVAGDVPTSFAPDGSRIIVPAQTRERFGRTSVSEAFDGMSPARAHAGRASR